MGQAVGQFEGRGGLEPSPARDLLLSRACVVGGRVGPAAMPEFDTNSWRRAADFDVKAVPNYHRSRTQILDDSHDGCTPLGEKELPWPSRRMGRRRSLPQVSAARRNRAHGYQNRATQCRAPRKEWGLAAGAVAPTKRLSSSRHRTVNMGESLKTIDD